MVQSIVVTGVGLVCSLGNSPAEVLSRALAGECGIETVPDVEGELGGTHLQAEVPDRYLDRVSSTEQMGTDRSVLFSLNAARAAWAMAGEPNIDPDDLGVSISAGLGGLSSMREAITKRHRTGSIGVRASTVPRIMPNAVAARVAIDLNARAGCYSPVSACASGLDALTQACRMIEAEEAQIVVTGGSEAVLDPMTFASFKALRALSKNTAHPDLACRPFDRERDGFVLAEGAAVLVVESAKNALRRGAPIVCCIEGMGVTSDAYHLVAPEPSGIVAARAMRKAMRSAARTSEEISGIYAHATGTRAGDEAEAKALNIVFADELPRTPVTGLKSMVGHLVGASGPLGVLVAAMALREGVLTPTPNFHSSDIKIDLDVVGKDARPLAPGTRVLLINAFGFGGQNVSVVLSDEMR